MMRKMKKLIALSMTVILCLLTVLAVHVFAADIYDGYRYETDEYGFAILLGWDNSSETLYVPSSIGRYFVAEIGNSAFNNDDYIKTLDLSGADHLDAIGMYAFANSALEGLVIIPSRVTYIGTSAFENCDGLTEVHYSSDGGSVSAQCFRNCDNLQTVVLTDYITTIERYAFYNCPNLSSVTIPRSVTSINATAFANDENLTIYCYYDSYAHHYAEDYGIDYVILDPENIPTEPPTEPATELLGYILGDVDNNGAVESIDATWIQRYSVQMELPIPEENMVQGDVDGDGETNIYDVTFIQRYVVDIPTPYPIGEFIAK